MRSLAIASAVAVILTAGCANTGTSVDSALGGPIDTPSQQARPHALGEAVIPFADGATWRLTAVEATTKDAIDAGPFIYPEALRPYRVVLTVTAAKDRNVERFEDTDLSISSDTNASADDARSVSGARFGTAPLLAGQTRTYTSGWMLTPGRNNLTLTKKDHRQGTQETAWWQFDAPAP